MRPCLQVCSKEKLRVGGEKGERERQRAEKMDQQLRVLAILPEDPISVPSTHIWWLRTACKSSSRESDTLLWPPWALAHTCTHNMHIHK